MSDAIFFILILCIGFFILIARLIRHADYDEQLFLSPGIYNVGGQIPPGRCDLMAESGAGNFCIKNKKANNWVLGSPLGTTSPQMPNRFRNVTLNKGDVLEINGNVTIMLSPPVPVGDLTTETLGPGNYRFGLDVPPDTYDFEVASGEGEVILVEISKNVYDFYQDMAAGHPLRAKTYNNVACDRNHELWITGSLQLKLKSKKPKFSLASLFK